MLHFFQVNCILAIGGDDGNAEGEIVLERIVCSLISPTFLPVISWTGKGKQKERKVALCRFTHLIDFIKVMTFKADNSFTEAQFRDKLIYGILKRAPSKYGASSKNDDNENVGDTSKPSTKVSNCTPQLAPMQQHQIPNHSQPLNTLPPNAMPLNPMPPNHPMPQNAMPPNAPPLNGPPPNALPYYPPNPYAPYGNNNNYYNQYLPDGAPSTYYQM